jgi:tetrahydromethanopterin S-methyltransferase subunit C
MATEQNSDRDKSLSELVTQMTDQSSALARMEVELAKAELAAKGKQIGIGAGAFGGAGLFGFYAFGALTAVLILVLAEFVDSWLAALIVTVVYAAVAGVLALVGRTRVQEASPPVPERAIESTREDIEVAKRSAQEARSDG